MTTTTMNYADYQEKSKELKLTKKDWFAKITTIVEKSDNKYKDYMVCLLAHEIETLSKKKSSSTGKSVEKASEQEKVQNEILEVMREFNKPMTATEIQRYNDTMSAYSNQKVTSMLKKLLEKGIVVRTIDKKKAVFALV
jgi:DNA-binding HxlR family transcriptional regulator